MVEKLLRHFLSSWYKPGYDRHPASQTFSQWYCRKK